MDIMSYFTNENIYNSIVASRIKILDKRNKLHSDREMSRHNNTHFHARGEYVGDKLLSEIIPSRRQWVKAGSKRRKLLNSKERIKYSLIETYKKVSDLFERRESVPIWYTNFLNFCEEIRRRLKKIDEVGFETPRIIPVVKKKLQMDAKTDCRPIAKYNLHDRIIIGLTARYFVNILDEEFLDNSFAFRKNSKFKQVSHHDAFQKIIDYRASRKKSPIYVAEYDIKKFYDCVNHELVLSHLGIIEERLKSKGILIDDIAKSVLRQYLNSYSFNHDVYTKNDDANWFKKRKILFGHFPWEEDGLVQHFYSSKLLESKIGVPQGGALSCVISNILLDNVDRRIMPTVTDPDLLYLRFCDDMIIMHTDVIKCQEYLDQYLSGIKDSKLLVHIPNESINTLPYSKGHWLSKAKPIYMWDNPHVSNYCAVPWVGFVGYQIRHDMIIRVRKDSIIKQKIKLKEEYKRVLNAINYHPIHSNDGSSIRTNYKSIVNTFKSRLISLSIGKPHPNTFKIEKYELCWANGFRLINNNIVSLRQLKYLDRQRTYYYYKIHKVIPKKKKDARLFPEGTKFKKIYYGTPFSYYSILGKNNEL